MIRTLVRRTKRVCVASLRPRPISSDRAGLFLVRPSAHRDRDTELLPIEAALHDLNNLLTGIAVTAALAEEALPPDHNLRPDLAAIRRATIRGVELAGQLCERPVPSAHCSIDLVTMLDELGPMCRALLGPQIVYRASPTAGLGPIAGDRAQLERVILNLVSNARDAMPRGGVLCVRLGIARGSPAARVWLTVRDSGAGMDSATLARVFAPGFTTRPHGSGLGLAICAEIVRQHGGSIRLASAPGQGTTVTIDLPYAHDTADVDKQHLIV